MSLEKQYITKIVAIRDNIFYLRNHKILHTEKINFAFYIDNKKVELDYKKLLIFLDNARAYLELTPNCHFSDNIEDKKILLEDLSKIENKITDKEWLTYAERWVHGLEVFTEVRYLEKWFVIW